MDGRRTSRFFPFAVSDGVAARETFTKVKKERERERKREREIDREREREKLTTMPYKLNACTSFGKNGWRDACPLVTLSK